MRGYIMTLDDDAARFRPVLCYFLSVLRSPGIPLFVTVPDNDIASPLWKDIHLQSLS
jgi:hypothetical protein